MEGTKNNIYFPSSLSMSPREPQTNPNLLSPQKHINSKWVRVWSLQRGFGILKKKKWGGGRWDSGLTVCTACGMAKIAVRITVIQLGCEQSLFCSKICERVHGF